ncbi:aminoacyl-tRNA hydrolase [Candidatus Peribacteria bacterium]|nr:aminoacyl-tRNA hydrolase [Candidatus Peribacteria bacterium]
MKLLLGLGNHPPQYAYTRHNVGFRVLEALAQAHDAPPWREEKQWRARLTAITIAGEKCLLAEPTTYMNASGQTAALLRHFYKLSERDIIAVYDDLDLPFGQLKFRQKGGPGSHNGMRSLHQHLGEDFARLKIGIGAERPAEMTGADFVLQRFSPAEETALPALLQQATARLEQWVCSAAPY